MDMSWLEIAESKGWPWLLAAMAVAYIVYHSRKLEPRLTEIENFVRIMQKTVDQNTVAMNAMAKSTDNVAETLKLLDRTLEGNLEMMKMSVEADQLTQKWLKDRKGRELDFEEILHYQQMIVALSETARIMQEIDKVGG